MSQQKIGYDEANRVLEAAFPKQGVTFRKPEGPSGAYKVFAASGEVLGSAFDLRTALQQAVRPVLKAEAARLIELNEAKKQEFIDFMGFLRERHNDDFNKWRQAKLDAEASKSDGDEPHPARLVSLVSE